MLHGAREATMGKKKKVKADQRVSVKVGAVWTTIRIRLDIPTAKLKSKPARRGASKVKKTGTLKTAAAAGAGTKSAGGSPASTQSSAVMGPTRAAARKAAQAATSSSIENRELRTENQ